MPILRHSAQKSVSCVSWRPLAGKELAVACHIGVLVWTIELGAASNSLSHAVLLKQRNHAPVTSVTWHPQGDLLVSCSPLDANMMIWDTCKKEGVPLRRVGGGGLSFTRWSSCGSQLFAATCRNVFRYDGISLVKGIFRFYVELSMTVHRVWNTGVATLWRADKWTVPSGRVAAAVLRTQFDSAVHVHRGSRDNLLPALARKYFRREESLPRRCKNGRATHRSDESELLVGR